MENVRRYNAHKLKLFGAVNNFKSVEEFWGQHVGESYTRVTPKSMRSRDFTGKLFSVFKRLIISFTAL